MTRAYKNIEEFVLSAFEKGTIPRAFRPTHLPSQENYDFLLEYKKSQFEKIRMEEKKDKLSKKENKNFEIFYGSEVDQYLNCLHFPAWPPDAFGFCAKLLDISGWYAEFEPRNIRFQKKDDSEAGENQALKDVMDRLGMRAFDYAARPEESLTDKFGILGTDFLELRIVGAIWAMGGVFATDPNFDLYNHQTERYVDDIKQGFDDIDTYSYKDRQLRTYPANHADDKLYELVLDYLEINYKETKNIKWRRFLDDIALKYFTSPKSPLSTIFGIETPEIIPVAKGPITDENVCSTLLNEQLFRRNISEDVRYLFEISNSSKVKTLVHPSAVTLSCYKRLIAAKAQNPNSVADPALKGMLLRCWATDYLQGRWLKLLTCQRPIRRRDGPPPARELPTWVRPAFRLMIAADEASLGIGFTPRDTAKGIKTKSLVSDIHTHHMMVRRRAGLIDNITNGAPNEDAPIDTVKRFRPRIVQSCLSKSVASIFPKSRTPSVGCTISSFSLNLCMLPPQGQLNARFLNSGVDGFDQDGSEAMNLLLVPYPYRVPTRSFNPADQKPDEPRWRNFTANQEEWLGTSWLQKYCREKAFYDEGKNLPEDVLELFSISTLIKMLLHSTSMHIDGIVLPELALDHRNFEYLKSYLAKHTGVKLLISGVSNAKHAFLSADKPLTKSIYREDVGGYLRYTDLLKGGDGNIVRTVFRPNTSYEKGTENTKKYWPVDYSRSKHHRWKLTESQIERYGLAARLDPSLSWWEKIDIFPREIGLFEISPGSLASALICEDLARIEPCQTALRSIGPNLIFVLLMDGPQLDKRWPNQYAGVLADDPGSSVLTLTSLGLIRREINVSRSKGLKDRNSRAIALWRDSMFNTQQLELPDDAQALVVTIDPEFKEESSLDGRNDGGNAAIWRLKGSTPITIKADSEQGKALLSGFQDSDWDPKRIFDNISAEEEFHEIADKYRKYVQYLENRISEDHEPKLQK